MTKENISIVNGQVMSQTQWVRADTTEPGVLVHRPLHQVVSGVKGRVMRSKAGSDGSRRSKDARVNRERKGKERRWSHECSLNTS